MSPEVLKKCCKEHKLYTTPALNDKLYLNFKGFHSIENLEPYTGVKALFLEGNALDSLIGLPRLSDLKCLFVQQNMIWEIDGLEGLDELDTLNISNNNIKTLQNLSHLPKLRTLLAASNRISSIEGLAHAAEMKSLSVLDVSNNSIEGTKEELLEILTAMPNLTCLYLKGNPIVSNVKQYRKTLISSLPGLTYLDDRPIFELERRCAEGWAKDGMEGEREARRKFKEDEKEVELKNHLFMQKIREEGFRKRREAMGLPPGIEDPYFEEFSDDEWQEPEEPPELVAARKKLASYSAPAGEEEPADVVRARQQLVRDGVDIKETARVPSVATVVVEEEEDAEDALGEVPAMAGEVTKDANLVVDVDVKAECRANDAAAAETSSKANNGGSLLSEEAPAAPVESFGGHKVEVFVSEDCEEPEPVPPAAGTLLAGSLDDLD